MELEQWVSSRLRVSDVCSEMPSDWRNYFGLLAEEFPRLIRAFRLSGINFCVLETVTGSVVTQKSRTWRFFAMYKLGEFVHYKFKITFRIAYYFRTNIRYSQNVSTRLPVGIWWITLTQCRAFSLFETVTGSRIRNLANLWYAQA